MSEALNLYRAAPAKQKNAAGWITLGVAALVVVIIVFVLSQFKDTAKNVARTTTAAAGTAANVAETVEQVSGTVKDTVKNATSGLPETGNAVGALETGVAGSGKFGVQLLLGASLGNSYLPPADIDEGLPSLRIWFDGSNNEPAYGRYNRGALNPHYWANILVQDSSGMPLAGARVLARPVSDAARLTQTEQVKQTDANGRCKFEWETMGTLDATKEFRAYANGFNPSPVIHWGG